MKKTKIADWIWNNCNFMWGGIPYFLRRWVVKNRDRTEQIECFNFIKTLNHTPEEVKKFMDKYGKEVDKF